MIAKCHGLQYSAQQCKHQADTSACGQQLSERRGRHHRPQLLHAAALWPWPRLTQGSCFVGAFVPCRSSCESAAAAEQTELNAQLKHALTVVSETCHFMLDWSPLVCTS